MNSEIQEKKENKRTLKSYFKIFTCGFIMGTADVIPGVSGGTMAFILGIYDELIESIRRFTGKDCATMVLGLHWKKAYQTLPWPFILALGSGILCAIAIFATPLQWLLINRLALILAFFFGLVLASVIAVLNRVKRWGFSRYAALLAGILGGWVIVGLPLLANPPDTWWYLMFCGAVAICAMILPGISGSFILLLMGKYNYVLNAVHELRSGMNLLNNLWTMILFCTGIVFGIAGFIRLLSWLLRHYHDITIAVLIGFMLGSLRKVWPWKIGDNIENGNILPAQIDGDFWMAIGLGVVGFVLVLGIEYVANKKETK